MTGFDGTMWELLSDNLASRADKIAVIDPGRSVTYAELAGEAGRVADWLRNRVSHRVTVSSSISARASTKSRPCSAHGRSVRSSSI